MHKSEMIHSTPLPLSARKPIDLTTPQAIRERVYDISDIYSGCRDVVFSREEVDAIAAYGVFRLYVSGQYRTLGGTPLDEHVDGYIWRIGNNPSRLFPLCWAHTLPMLVAFHIHEDNWTPWYNSLKDADELLDRGGERRLLLDTARKAIYPESLLMDIHEIVTACLANSTY